MRLLRHPPSPKSRRLLLAPSGAARAASLAATAMGTSSPHASPSLRARTSRRSRSRRPGRIRATVFRVILQGAGARGETRVVSAVRAHGVSVARRLGTVSGASAAVTGRQLPQPSAAKGVAALTHDRPVRLLDDADDGSGSRARSSGRTRSKAPEGLEQGLERQAADCRPRSRSSTPASRRIAPDFDNGAGVLTAGRPWSTPARRTRPATATATARSSPASPSGSAQGYAGASPSAPLVSLDVLDDQGHGPHERRDRGLRLDRQAQGQVQHPGRELLAPRPPRRRACSGIRSTRPSRGSWFDGVTVVAASGNYGTGDRPSGVLLRARQRPLRDHRRRRRHRRHDRRPGERRGGALLGLGLHARRLRQARASPRPAATWSARSPTTRTLATTRPGDVVAPGYDAAFGHVVRGAGRLGRGRATSSRSHPKWTPDQVKGALMLSAKSAAERDARLGRRRPGGRRRRAQIDGSPPNPNVALDKFVAERSRRRRDPGLRHGGLAGRGAEEPELGRA